MGLLIFLGRFLYVPFLGDWDVEYPDRLFGFKWLSTFLSRIGNEFSWLAVGLFIRFITNFFQNDLTEIKKYTKYFANLIIVTALYFISWAFYDNYNFSRNTEMMFAASTAIMAFYIVSKLMGPILGYIESLLSKIRYLVDIIILRAPDHVMDQTVWHYEVVEPMLDKLDE